FSSRRRHTRFSRDWSSDVCSSDLTFGALQSLTRVHLNHYRYDGFFPREVAAGGLEVDRFRGSWVGLEQRFVYDASENVQVTFGGDRKSVVSGKSVAGGGSACVQRG